jgi:MYXO-CTERM domain-containing protein
VNQPDTSAFVSGQCVGGCCTAPCGVGASSTWRFSWNGLTQDRDYKWRGYLTNLQIASGCSSTLADAQTNSTSPQFAFFRTQSTNPPATAYGLMLHASDGGSLDVNPQPPSGQTRYAPGTQVTVTATPASGYVLSSILVDGNTASSPVTLTMSQDHAIDAEFVLDTTNPAADGGDDGGGGGGGGGGGCGSAGGTPGDGVLWSLAGVLALAWRRRRCVSV